MSSSSRPAKVAKTASSSSSRSAAATASGSGTASTSRATAAPPSKSTLDVPSTDAHLELLTEHLGINPKVFIDTLVYLANEHLYIIGEQFENFVRGQMPDDAASGLEVEKGVHAVLTLLENALDHTFDTLELYCLRSVFGITPRQARCFTLSHHRGLDLRSAEQRAAANQEAARRGKGRKSVGGKAVREEEQRFATAGDESDELERKEEMLLRKIQASRAVRHALIVANHAAEHRLARATALEDTFASLILEEPSSDVASGDAQSAAGGSMRTLIPSSLSQTAVKLKADAMTLLAALEELREQDPLGKPLVEGVPSGAAAGGGTKALKQYEVGREAYVQWEAERAIRALKAQHQPAAASTTAGRRAQQMAGAGKKGWGGAKGGGEEEADEGSEKVGGVGQTDDMLALADVIRHDN